jgi:hypothetical protein
MRWIDKYKPAGSTRTQALLAAGLWSLVGAGLLIAGIIWGRASDGPWFLLLLATAAGVGLLKAHFALSKTAGRIADRISGRGNGRCLGGFLSWRMWLVVLAMMLLGRVLRTGILPQALIAFIYQAVGVALLVGAISLWRAWSRLPRPA